MKFRQLLTGALIFTTLTSANAQPFLKEGMLFSHARTLLLKDGWVPVDLHPNSQALDVGTQEVILIKKGIREVDICSMDAGALCNFFYKKKQICLRVTTRGEALNYMHVIDWKTDSSCPGKS